MAGGARRRGVDAAGLRALRWSDVELDEAVLTLRRSVYVDEDGQVVEKDTKTHQQRPVAPDAETVEVLREHRRRMEERAEALDLELAGDARVFSYEPALFGNGAHLGWRGRADSRGPAWHG